MIKVKLKTFENLQEDTITTIMDDAFGEPLFVLIHKDGLSGSIYPMMIKYLGKEIEVEKNINPDTYEMKEWLDENSYLDIKIRSWMLEN